MKMKMQSIKIKLILKRKRKKDAFIDTCMQPQNKYLSNCKQLILGTGTFFWLCIINIPFI